MPEIEAPEVFYDGETLSSLRNNAAVAKLLITLNRPEEAKAYLMKTFSDIRLVGSSEDRTTQIIFLTWLKGWLQTHEQSESSEFTQTAQMAREVMEELNIQISEE
jgi:hypothetical protein